MQDQAGSLRTISLNIPNSEQTNPSGVDSVCARIPFAFFSPHPNVPLNLKSFVTSYKELGYEVIFITEDFEQLKLFPKNETTVLSLKNMSKASVAIKFGVRALCIDNTICNQALNKLDYVGIRQLFSDCERNKVLFSPISNSITPWLTCSKRLLIIAPNDKASLIQTFSDMKKSVDILADKELIILYEGDRTVDFANQFARLIKQKLHLSVVTHDINNCKNLLVKDQITDLSFDQFLRITPLTQSSTNKIAVSMEL